MALIGNYPREPAFLDQYGTLQSPRGKPWPSSPSFWATAIYLALFVIRPWERLFPWMAVVPVERSFAILTLLIMLFEGRLALKLDAQSIAVLFFVACVGLTGIVAEDSSSFQGNYYAYLTQVIFFFILVSVIRSPHELATLALWWLGVMWLYVGKSLWEYFVHGAHDFKQGVTRLIGIENMFGEPNECAALMCFTLPILLFVYRARHAFSPKWRQALNLGIATYAIMALTGIVLTNSRSGMLKTLVFVLLAGLQARGWGTRMVRIGLALVVLLCLWMAMPETSRNRFRTLWDPESGPEAARGSAEGRMVAWHMALQEFERSPLLGVGMGNFRIYRVKYLDGKDLEAHTLPGQALGETGFLGTGAFVLMLAVFLSNCRRTIALARQYTDPELECLAGLATACSQIFVLLLVAGLAGNVMFFYHWLWIVAFAALSSRFATEISQYRRAVLANLSRVHPA